MSEIIKLVKDEYLIHEGEESTEMYFIQEGSLSIRKRKGDREVELGPVYSGELVGEMSFLDKSPRSASVRAISDCKVVAIPSEKLESFLSKQPSWFRALLNTLLDRLRKANSRIKV